jgi:hypothetical protein
VDANVKRNWLWGLRSGYYPQSETVSYLKDGLGEYCPFGVLLETNGVEFVRSQNDEEELTPYHMEGLPNSSVLPPSDWLEERGITQEIVDVVIQLTNAGLTFKEIADAIDKRY